MGRRKQQGFVEDVADLLLEIFTTLPWWVGPPVIMGAFLLFHSFIPGALNRWARQGDSGKSHLRMISEVPREVFGTLSRQSAPWIMGGVGCLWIWGLWKKSRNRSRLNMQTGIQSIHSLSWREFEELLSEAFRRQGYQVEHPGKAGPDGGIDLKLMRRDERILVQCKHWKREQVGVAIIREILGVVTSEGADSGIVVTSGTFTLDARQFASQNSIKLIDRDALITMIGEVQGKTRQVPVGPHSAVEQPSLGIKSCPRCGAPMKQRTARRGVNAGSQFWGCERYPQCQGTLPLH